METGKNLRKGKMYNEKIFCIWKLFEVLNHSRETLKQENCEEKFIVKGTSQPGKLQTCLYKKKFFWWRSS